MFGHKKKTILVVEDADDLYEVIHDTLDMSGFPSVQAKTYDDALTILKERSDISVMWIDHYLIGEKSGLDLVKQVRSEQTYNDLPIIVVTTADSEIVNKYTEIGVTKCYMKSDYKLKEIIEDIKLLLKGL